jgi:hypothetical protein
MASPDPRTVFLVFIVILAIVIVILLGICWRFLKPDIMRKLMRPRSPGSGDRNHGLPLWNNTYFSFIASLLVVSNTDRAILTVVPDVPEYFSSNMSGNLRTITYFDYATLKKATRDFNQKNQLGRGGFGPVYLVRFYGETMKHHTYCICTARRLVISTWFPLQCCRSGETRRR